MTPRIEISNEKKLAGNKLTMSLADFRVGELWQLFLPRRKAISNNLTSELISMAVYPSTYFANFSPSNEFQKWAAVEVSGFENNPDEMEKFTLESGLYAVFDYKGPNTNSIFQYILGTWLPNSEYQLDDRPHFEVLGEKYKNNDPNSEEEIWIPIKPNK
ncbi:MAG: GyrI-like domain-containing protein [Acidobacteria bacterium]|nr:GyrI-like domain-containing protein [Acidobacteriota bacterium]